MGGLALGISLLMYGRLEEADAIIESLCQDQDPLLRRSGMYSIAMAYCGTGSNKAIRKLLHSNMLAVVGMLVFTQYWSWFPLAHFLGLAFTPSCLIALNQNLDMPVIKFKSNAKPSMYGYPAMLEEKKKEDKEKVATAVLSIT